MTVTLGTGAGSEAIGGLSFRDVVAVARHDVAVALSDEARAAIEASAAIVARLAATGEPVYGVSTGFGALATTYIDPSKRAELQRSLVRSHAAGTGPVVEREVVRAMMMLRARSLAAGYSGVRRVVVDRILDLLNGGVTPLVHEHGSLGCSGDLAPLSHCALALMGEGPVEAGGAIRPAAEVFAERRWAPVELGAKEGLALINGTDGMLGMLVLALDDLRALLAVADVTAAMTVEALLGTDQAFRDDLQRLRPQPGQAISAANLTRLLDGSTIVASHRTGDPRVQDAYSLRCSPQVHGAARDACGYAGDVATRELASAIDNPVVLPDGTVASCGNFHGAPVAHACDFLAIVVADVASIAERRLDRLLDASRNHGMAPFLADDPGVDSGLMIAQYTAAGLVAECKRLAVPASADSIPSSAMQEDHVSMGWAAARKLRRAVANLRQVLAIELVAAARGLDLRQPLAPAPGTGAARDALRARVAGPGPDRFLAPDLAAADDLVRDGAILDAVESAIGKVS